MVVAEISAGVTSLRAALDITKAMVDLRDAEAFRSKSIELQGVVLQAFKKAIVAREAYSTQAERIRALDAEVADLKACDAEKQKYELKPNYAGAVTYMLKPGARGSEPPHWLCPNCYANGKKSFLLPKTFGNLPTQPYKMCRMRDRGHDVSEAAMGLSDTKFRLVAYFASAS
jgi:hypothetical protein